MDISSVSSAASTLTKAEASEASLADSFDTFLTLLTTQLKYQDPLEPMDSAEFTNQLVQFTEVEQSISTNKQLEQLIGMQSSNQAVAALGYIGNQVEATGSQLPLVGGSAELTYTLPENAKEARVVIVNQSGQLVRTLDGNITAGKHTLAWDGTMADGTQLPDGTYTFAVSARNAEGSTLEVPTGIIGTVTGTQNDENGAYLSVGPVIVGLHKIVSVTKPVAEDA